MTDEEQSIWIRTTPSPDGNTYVVAVDFDPDNALVLDKTQALEYAYAIMTSVQHAEHDAAVMKQLTRKLGLPLQDSALLIADLRKDRPEVDYSAFGPFALKPGVTAKFKPFLVVELHGEPAGQWEVPAAREHALRAIEATASADLDAAYYRALRGLVGVSDTTARGAVGDLLNHRIA